MAEPAFLESFKGFVGSTAKTMCMFSKSRLKLNDEPADSPLKIPVLLYTVLNGKTAQLDKQFSELPEVSVVNDNVLSGLGKLRAIAADPTAKGIKEQAKLNYDLFNASYVTPAKNVQVDIQAVETLKTGAKKLADDQFAAILDIIQTIQKAPSPKTASDSPQVREIFNVLDKQREKIAGGLKTVNMTLRNTYTTLTGLFKQIFSSIPPTERTGIRPPEPEQNRNVMD